MQQDVLVNFAIANVEDFVDHSVPNKSVRRAYGSSIPTKINFSGLLDKFGALGSTASNILGDRIADMWNTIKGTSTVIDSFIDRSKSLVAWEVEWLTDIIGLVSSPLISTQKVINDKVSQQLAEAESYMIDGKLILSVNTWLAQIININLQEETPSALTMYNRKSFFFDSNLISWDVFLATLTNSGVKFYTESIVGSRNVIVPLYDSDHQTRAIRIFMNNSSIHVQNLAGIQLVDFEHIVDGSDEWTEWDRCFDVVDDDYVFDRLFELGFPLSFFASRCVNIRYGSLQFHRTHGYYGEDALQYVEAWKELLQETESLSISLPKGWVLQLRRRSDEDYTYYEYSWQGFYNNQWSEIFTINNVTGYITTTLMSKVIFTPRCDILPISGIARGFSEHNTIIDVIEAALRTVMSGKTSVETFTSLVSEKIKFFCSGAIRMYKAIKEAMASGNIYHVIYIIVDYYRSKTQLSIADTTTAERYDDSDLTYQSAWGMISTVTGSIVQTLGAIIFAFSKVIGAIISAVGMIAGGIFQAIQYAADAGACAKISNYDVHTNHDFGVLLYQGIAFSMGITFLLHNLPNTLLQRTLAWLEDDSVVIRLPFASIYIMRAKQYDYLDPTPSSLRGAYTVQVFTSTDTFIDGELGQQETFIAGIADWTTRVCTRDLDTFKMSCIAKQAWSSLEDEVDPIKEQQYSLNARINVKIAAGFKLWGAFILMAFDQLSYDETTNHLSSHVFTSDAPAIYRYAANAIAGGNNIFRLINPNTGFINFRHYDYTSVTNAAWTKWYDTVNNLRTSRDYWADISGEQIIDAVCTGISKVYSLWESMGSDPDNVLSVGLNNEYFNTGFYIEPAKTSADQVMAAIIGTIVISTIIAGVITITALTVRHWRRKKRLEQVGKIESAYYAAAADPTTNSQRYLVKDKDMRQQIATAEGYTSYDVNNDDDDRWYRSTDEIKNFKTSEGTSLFSDQQVANFSKSTVGSKSLQDILSTNYMKTVRMNNLFGWIYGCDKYDMTNYWADTSGESDPVAKATQMLNDYNNGLDDQTSLYRIGQLIDPSFNASEE